jgi:hypothetical protein
LYRIQRIQQVCFASAWRRATHIDASHCAMIEDKHGTASRPAGVGIVADADVSDVRNTAVFV